MPCRRTHSGPTLHHHALPPRQLPSNRLTFTLPCQRLTCAACMHTWGCRTVQGGKWQQPALQPVMQRGGWLCKHGMPHVVASRKAHDRNRAVNMRQTINTMPGLPASSAPSRTASRTTAAFSIPLRKAVMPMQIGWAWASTCGGSAAGPVDTKQA